jgi:S1-C subfamily serine protease
MEPEVEVTDSGVPRKGSVQGNVANALGIKFASPNGCIIGTVVKGGPADKVGLQPGDSITECNGGEVDCPATLDPWLFCGKEPGLVELTVLRPTGEGESCGGAAGGSDEPEKK